MSSEGFTWMGIRKGDYNIVQTIRQIIGEVGEMNRSQSNFSMVGGRSLYSHSENVICQIGSEGVIGGSDI